MSERKQLQDELRTLDSLREQYREACANIAEAERLIHAGEKNENFRIRAEETAAEISRKMSHIQNHHEPRLRSLCNNPELNAEARRLKSQLQFAQNNLDAASQGYDEAKRIWQEHADFLRSLEDKAGAKFERHSFDANGYFKIKWVSSFAQQLDIDRRHTEVLIQTQQAAESFAVASEAKEAVLRAIDENRKARTWSPI